MPAEGEAGPEPYGFKNPERISEWLATNPPPFEAQRVRFWFRRLAADPLSVERLTIRTTGLERHTTVVPETNTQVSWCVATSPPYPRENRCIHIVDIRPVPADLAEDLREDD